MDLSRGFCAHNPIIRTANGRWCVKSTASPDGPDSPLSERSCALRRPEALPMHPRSIPQTPVGVSLASRPEFLRKTATGNSGGESMVFHRDGPTARPVDHENPSHDADASPRILPRAGRHLPAALVVVRCRRRPNGATVRPLSSSPLCV